MEIIKLTPELYFLRFPKGHAYLCQDGDGLTLIDTSVPGSAPQIADAIRTLGHHPADLRKLVLTHCHVDHAGAAAEITSWGNVEVLAHGNDAPFIQGDAKAPPPDLLDWERPLYEQLAVRTALEHVKVDRILGDGDMLDVCGGARVVAAPGHTPGSIAIHLISPNVVFAGDAAARTPNGEVILGVFNCNPVHAANSFRRLADLRPAIVCFGHGEPLSEEAALLMEEATHRMPV
jgi:glyoxylase-like metal-dependent hydrolase (beta-lactamase superfamily II)